MFEVWSGQLNGCDECGLGNIPLTGFTNAANSLAQAEQAAKQISSAQRWSAIMNTISSATTAAAAALSRPRQSEPFDYSQPRQSSVPTLPPQSADDFDYADTRTRQPRDKVEAVTWSSEGLTVFGTTLSPTVLLAGAGMLYLLFKEPPRRGGR